MPKNKKSDSDKKKNDKYNIPLLYLYIYKTLIDKFGKRDIIVSRKKVLEIWRRSIHNIPRKYDFFILKEMDEYGLIRKLNNQDYELFGLSFDNKICLNDKCIMLDKLKPSEIRVLQNMAPKQYKFIGSDANKKLKKLNEFFLW